MLVSTLDVITAARTNRLTIGGLVMGAVIAACEVAAIMLVAIASGAAWHGVVYGKTGDPLAYAAVGVLAGIVYATPFFLRLEYRVDEYLAGRRTVARIVSAWTYAFFALFVLAFLTKTTGLASRGALALFFVSGGVAAVVVDAGLRRLVGWLVAESWIRPRRLLVVGAEPDVAAFVSRHNVGATGVEIAATAFLLPADPNDLCPDAVRENVERVVETARPLGVNDVLILKRDAETSRIAAMVADRFMDLPVSVHLGQLSIAEQFPEMHVSQLGRVRTLALRSAPLNPFQMYLKRAFDLVAASLGLVLVLPLFALIGVLIKLDSSGPIFFRQRRRGFNQHEFAIWKFRTMSTMDDGPEIRQATQNDPRITRTGRWLRRYNLDELPQLLNVIAGEMSLVGPRPHAVAHDKYYERVIRRYARRLNVKPGITGWAQVNGFRGQTETEHAMRSRIAHDLYYIDNWSIVLDLYIIALTIVSPKAFRNAG